MKTLIQNASVVLPHEVREVDVLIDGSVIASLDPAPTLHVDMRVDARVLSLSLHTHTHTQQLPHH